MRNNFLSKAYGGVMEAQHKLNGLGLPRQWKVMTSTLLLLFTFAIGNVWGADDVYYVMMYNSITEAGALTSSSSLSNGIVKYTSSTGKYASSTDIEVTGMGGSKSSKYNNSSISNFTTVGNWAAGSGTAYAAGAKFTTLTIGLGTKHASSIKFIGYRNTSRTSDMTIGETKKNTAKKPSTYGSDCLLEWTGDFTGDVSVSATGEHVGVFVITVPEAKYSVTYKAGDGTGDEVVDSDAKTVKAFADCSFTAPSGYEFKEWQDGSSNVVAAGKPVSADMTLTAIYRLIPTKYTVTYNLNGASGDAPTETSKAEGDAFNLAAAPSWAGHAFDGWLCSADEAVKAAGSSYTMTAANTTFTAQWHEVDCKIYSFTGGIGSAEIVADEGNASISAESLVLKGSNAIIKLTPAAGETFKAGDVVTISGTVGNTERNFGVKISNTNDKQATLGTISVAGNTVPMIASGTLTGNADYLYLVRDGGTTQTMLTFEVHRACAEGTAAGLGYANTEVAKTEGDAAFTNPLTNANGLVIAGYKSSNTAVATVATNGQVTVVGPGSATITANSAVQTKAGTLYAAGTASYTLTVAALPKYHVTYDLNGGSGEVAEVDHKAGEKFTLHDGVTGVTAPGSKTFVNWKDQDDALFDGGVEYTMPAKDVTLTAQWAGDVYTVKFMDGETVLDTKVVEVGSHPTDIEHPTKPLYTFAAWQLSGSDVNLDDVSGAKDAVVTLTARWAAAYASNVNFKEAATQALGVETALNTYHYASDASDISFEAKGLKIKTNAARFYFNVAPGKVAEIKFGDISGATYSVDGGAAETLSASQLKATYSASAQSCVMTMTTAAYNIVEKITIHDPYEVNYDADGGNPVAAQYGEPSVTLPLPVKGTESFLGWFDGETKVGEAGDKYTPTANITLKAHWEAISTDARLASITFSSDAGTLSPTFDPEVTSYTYTMPYGTAAVPTITAATSVSAKAQEPQIVSQASAWGETAVIRGVAESSDTKAYNITMLRAPKDGVCLVWADIPSNSTITYNATKSKYFAESDVTLATTVSGKDGSAPSGVKFQGGTYIHIGGAFLAGDVLALDVTYAANGTNQTMYVYDAQAGAEENIIGTLAGGKTPAGLNEVTLTKDAADLWLVRGGQNSDWNPHVDYVAVYRAMNPILKAITINGEAGIINESAKTVAVELQPGYDLAALTINTTIISNTAEGDVVKTVESNSGNWVIGDNTYRLTDKDGDYTEYTVTLTAGELKHYVSFNTHGGSTIDPVQVVDGQKLAAAPEDPTKDDYIFQGWAETEDGSIVDVTSFTISADKEFHAIWASDGAIKLLDGATVNHTNFITGVTADETVEFMGNTVNYAKFSGTCGSVTNVKDLTKSIIYNATTNKTKIKISAHNNSTSGRNIYVIGLVEGASEAVILANIALGNKEDKISDWIEFDNAANRTIYIMVPSSAGDVYFTQVKVIESGETPMKQAGEVGYSLNFNKGRFFGVKNLTAHFEGLDVEVASSDCAPLNTEVVKLASTSMSFTVASAMTLSVTTNNNKTYYVTKGSAGTDNETAKAGASDFDLTAGTWYITGGASNVEITNIAFSAPKCEQPMVVDMENIGLCEGDAFTALTVSASVTDGGTLHYQWYKHPAAGDDEAVGTDAASYTPEADGQYYVVVTNQLAGYSDNSKKSDIVTVTHFASAVITTAPLNQRATVGNNVTLSVAATGKNVAYKWYTCDEDGSNEAALDPEQTGTSIEVTITAGLLQWYKVKVTSDCGNVEAMAKVEEFVPATPANVTTSMVWDWKSTTAGFPTENTSIDFANTSVEELFADVDAAMPNNAEFRSDMLYGIGQRAWRKSDNDGECGFQGFQIRFYTEVAGRVRVYFRAPSSGQTSVVTINGRQAGSRGNSWGWSEYVDVEANTNVIIAMTNGETGMTRVQKIEFQTPNYVRTEMLGNGVYGTICVDHNVPEGGVRGVTVYEIAGREPQYGKIAFDEVTEMEAGVPYVFIAHGNEMALYYGETTVANPVNGNGMYGTFVVQTLTELDGIYYFAQKALWSCVDLTSLNLPANRAYVKLSEIDYLGSSSPAPGRKRLLIGVNGAPAVATGFENVQGDNVQCTKVLINGQLFILRGEKMYDAKGQLVK